MFFPHGEVGEEASQVQVWMGGPLDLLHRPQADLEHHKAQLGPDYRPTAWRGPGKKQAGLIPRAGFACHLHARLDGVPRWWVQGMACEVGSCVKRPGRDA